tara:strand:- start:208 stop:498 length:291 start_codon:yes stop_codon:yes gene_type:complete
MLSLLRILVVFVATVIGLLFGYLNFQSAPIDLLVVRTQAPLVVLLAAAFVLGLLIAVVLFTLRVIRLKTRLSSSKRKLKDAEAEIDSLRSAHAGNA